MGTAVRGDASLNSSGSALRSRPLFALHTDHQLLNNRDDIVAGGEAHPPANLRHAIARF